MIYFTIFIFQILFNIFKVLEIRYTYENKLKKLLINSVWINLLSLTSFYISIDSLLSGDWLIVPFYIIGGLVGKWIAMSKIKNIRYRVFKFIQLKK
jgi:hypothetical protein